MRELKMFLDALMFAWDYSTSHPSVVEHAQDGSPIGQCVVTALVVQDYLGGEIVRGRTSSGNHYWNYLPGTGEIDLTRGQYSPDEVIIREHCFVRREDLLTGDRAAAARTAERYTLVKQRIDSYLGVMS